MMNNELKAFFAEFENNGRMPDKNTAKGTDIAPEIRLENLSERAKTLAVIMRDLDVPFGVLCHWVAWNIPAGNVIPPVLPSGAVCGRAYGKNRYAGP
ncbi:MAG: YbhB/YbcL family Raf kinase inhibitor-like protein, partial [Oscillospiraceae bacterium]|nr:YbhB/YbcL family Raf kinase inhibitor-like protein [Oscillospiraceae bacterium]